MINKDLLLRQVHPTWIQNGQPTSQAFKPTLKDKGLLSTYQRSKITPQAAWEHYTKTLGFHSSGVWAISVEECIETGTEAREDPLPFPAHAVVDFTKLNPKQIENVSKILKNRAIARGCQHSP